MSPSSKQTLKIFFEHTIRYKLALGLFYSGIIVASFTEIYAPLLYKRFFDSLSNTQNWDSLIHILYIILAVNALQWVFKRIRDFSLNYLTPRVMEDLANTCYQYLMRHSYNFFNNSFTGTLVRRVNRFVSAYDTVSSEFMLTIGPIILKVAVILIVLYSRNIYLGITLGLWCLLYILFNYFFALYKLKYDLARAAADSEATGHLADTVSNQLNLKLFGGLSREERTFAKIIKKQAKLRELGWNLGGIVEAVQAFLIVVLEFAMMYIALRYWQKGLITVGDFVLIQAYLGQIIGRLWDLGRLIRRIYENLADANEMTDVLMEPHEITDVLNAKTLKVSHGNVSFENVSFAYQVENEKVFRNFNLEIRGKERVALIGLSGGGKTTITKLLFRFFDIQKGQILIDDQNIAQLTQESLRKNIALVPQEPILFHRSLFENIRYGRAGASSEEVVRASKIAHCHEFISKLPQGYDTFVGERGVKLSGGERQRVAIARAILKNAPILVLDEATSSLDSESESLIQEALKVLMKEKTVLVIAHRLSTIMQMDRIVVLENGKITEQGTHSELVKAKQGTYQRLWEIQAGGFVS